MNNWFKKIFADNTQATDNIVQPEQPIREKHDQLKLKFLELDAACAKANSDFHNHGISLQKGVLADMHAEKKYLEAEVYKLKILIKKENADVAHQKENNLLGVLIRNLKADGQLAFLEKARAETTIINRENISV
jgi:hypothetical protein